MGILPSMNRGFLIIIGPALLVALTYLAVGWGVRVAFWFGLAVLVLAAAAVVVRWGWNAWKKSQT